MSYTIHHRYKYFYSPVQRAKDRRKKFHICRLPFDVTSSLISLVTHTNSLENKSFASKTLIWVCERDLVVFCHSLSLLSTPGYYRQPLNSHTCFTRTPGYYERLLVTCSRLIRARAQHGYPLITDNFVG